MCKGPEVQEGMSHVWTEHQDSRCTENKGENGQDEWKAEKNVCTRSSWKLRKDLRLMGRCWMILHKQLRFNLCFKRSACLCVGPRIAGFSPDYKGLISFPLGNSDGAFWGYHDCWCQHPSSNHPSMEAFKILSKSHFCSCSLFVVLLKPWLKLGSHIWKPQRRKSFP